jgi:hypothetical protein
MGAVIESGDHFVFSVEPWIDIDQLAYPVQLQYGEPLLCQSAEITAGSFHPHQGNIFSRDWVLTHPFGAGVPSSKIGVARVSTQASRP